MILVKRRALHVLVFRKFAALREQRLSASGTGSMDHHRLGTG
jgi:hypothetical protein